MRAGRSKDLVAAAALLGALGLGGFLFLRARGLFGSSWTDGERRFASQLGERVRHAVWDHPDALESLGEAGDPALSPDGRLLVFTCGTRGLNCELFVADLVDGAPLDPRPLAALATSADELAPAFSGGELYFASDRPGGAGGLDLWRAPYSDGEFGAAERLGPGLNSAADETDPAPVPGTRTLLFASNRGRSDFDLFAAAPDTDGVFAVRPLVELNSPADEREPALSPDPRSLYFASDREARGDFDLHRALRGETGWGAPDPVAELSSRRSERGPWLAADGFALWFAREGEDGTSGLARARSLELLRVPAPPITLGQWLTLAALLLLALLALLAKRWHALDVLYRCVLVSLILHLLLMLYLRTVIPDETRYELGPDAGSDGPTFRVNREVLEPEADGRGLTGPAEPSLERFEPAPATAPAEAPALAELALPGRAEEPSPAREAGVAPDAREAPRTELAAPLEASARYAARAPALELQARAGAERADASAPAPERAAGAATPLNSIAPDAAELASAEAASGELARGVERGRTLERAADSAPSAALAAPDERFERVSGAAPALALAARDAAGLPGEARPERAQLEGAPGPQANPVRSAGEGLAPVEADADAAPARERLAASGPARPAAADTPELRAPSGEATRAPAVARESFDALAGLAAPASPSERALASPARAGRGPSGWSVLSPAPAHAPASLAAAAAGGEAPAPAIARASASGSAPLAAPAPELRGPEAGTMRANPVAKAEFDALAGLAPSAGAPAARELGGPGRETLRSAELGAAEPAASELPLARAPQEDVGVPAIERSRADASASRPPTDRGPELRAPLPDAAPARAPTRPSASFDATAGLDVASAPVRAGPAAPERASASAARAPAPAQPEARALPLDAAASPELDRPAPPRLSETPYQNRFGEQKLRALEEFGGTVETERAVAAGLAYLARIQAENGAWGQRSDAHGKYLDVRIGKSALALLAFLGAGHVPGGSTEHAAVVERTVRYLVDAQDAGSGHFGRSCSYGHGIATYALAECYALTQDEDLRAPLEHAVEEILRHQSELDDPRFFGGWGYYFADGHVWNGDEWPRTSVTAWQVMALESARLGGLAVPAPAFEGAREFLVHAWDASARAFRYDHDPERLSSGYPILPASTPAALFALSLLGADAAGSELAPARRFVLARAPDGYRYTGDDDFVQRARGNLYFWYYATLAMFRVGGGEWERWNSALKETLLPAQDEDGSWRPLDVYSEYAGDEDEERTYSTAMCVLSLEVYYRYFTPLLQVR